MASLLSPMSDAGWKVEVLLTGSWRGATSVLLSNRGHHIVVDTGLPHEAHQLVGALKQKGLDPTDIGTVINTHFHVDHVMNNCLFPKSTIYASQQSYDWCLSMYSDVAKDAQWEELALKYYPETPHYEQARDNMAWLRKFALRWWDVKRLGEPSQFRWIETQPLPDGLEGLVTSGHVPGHTSIIIHSDETPTVIAADALLSREHDEQVLTMIPYNRAQYHLDRARLLALGGYILPGHDRGFLVDAHAVNDATQGVPPFLP
jgi:glyoxylase-like metal-dependent hydrolase (beta-lactamase superfamily II)